MTAKNPARLTGRALSKEIAEKFGRWHAEFCAVAIKFFEEVARLPVREAASVMREVLAHR